MLASYRFAAAACFLALAGGCVDAQRQAAIEKAQTRYLLSEAPPEAVPVAALKQMPLEGSSGAPVNLTGIVGGMPNPWPEREAEFPFRKGQAVLFVVDPTVAEEFAGHAHDPQGPGCAFCDRKAREHASDVAAVTFAQEGSTSPIAIEARDLFNLHGGDVVTITGSAKWIGDAKTGLIEVLAEGMHVSRSAAK